MHTAEGALKLLASWALVPLKSMTALRRSRSVLANAAGVLPDDVRTRFGTELRWLAGSTGRARDLDVYDLEWGDYVGALPPETVAALQPVREQIRADRDEF